MSEKAEDFRSHLEQEVPDWFDNAEKAEPEMSKTDEINYTQSAASILEVNGKERFIRRPGEADTDPEDIEVVIHMGCHSVRTPIIIESTMDVVEELDYDAIGLGGYNNCCGIMDLKRGDAESAKQVDSNRFSNISAFDPDYAIAECSACHANTQTAFLGDRSPEFEFPFLIDFLNERKDAVLNQVEISEPIKIAFHDHFDARGWMPDGQSEKIRELFSILPGVEIVEMDHSKSDRLPCAVDPPEDNPYSSLNDQIYEEATQAGADLLLSVWHGCHLCLLSQEHDYPIKTKNYATFLAERFGFEYRDKNREYTRAAQQGNYDWIIEDAKPIFRANGLSEKEAREVAETYYPLNLGSDLPTD